MLFITSEHRRELLIGNAIIAYMKEDPEWFRVIRHRIKCSILANPDKREQVILKWVMSAEKVGAHLVKEEILKVYDKRSSPEAD